MPLTRFGLYRLFIKENKQAWFGIIFAAFITGVLQGCIVLIINQAAGDIMDGGPRLRMLLMFLLVLAAYSVAGYYANSKTIALTESIIFSTFVGIADKLRNTRTLSFEQTGKQQIYATLYTNTDIILETSKSLASVGAAVVMIVFCAVYIALISKSAIMTIVVFYIFGIFVYTSNLKRAQKLLKETTVLEDRFKDIFKYFLEGFKEIKVNHEKGKDLLENYVMPTSEAAKQSRVKAENQMSVNIAFIQSFYYALVAAMIFLLPRLGSVQSADIIRIAAVVLFSYGSMTRIVLNIPLILKSERAIEKINRLETELTAAAETSRPYAGRFASSAPSDLSIRLEDVSFHYPGERNDYTFTLGPLSLDIEPGRLIFIIGGNGSGKTTLLKLLTGLYPPDAGRIFLKDRLIDDSCYEDYRELFGIIFPDYYLFDRFYGMKTVDPGVVDSILVKLGMGGLAGWNGECFTNLNLSAGQRKRLALLSTHVEAAPILVMDEVTADLDPQFRKFFYEEYLQELKARGRTIIAVSHDEKYFHVADRVIKLENGKIVST